MENLKISVAVSVLNEEKNIVTLLNSLTNQKIQPAEIIFSDGGSTDNTKKIIKTFAIENNNCPEIKVIDRKGKCRGAGRNTAIENCNFEYVAFIDCGHKADKEWIQGFHDKLLEQDKKVDVIYGLVQPEKNNFFSKILSSFILGNKNHSGCMEKSVASFLITKKIWSQIGKFDESNDGSYIVEDLSFLKKIEINNLRTFNSRSSKTYWLMVNNYTQLFNKYSEYSEGAINAGYFKVWHLGLIRNYSIYSFTLLLSFFYNNFFLFLLIILIIIRSLLYVNKNDWFKDSNISYKLKYLFGFTLLITIIDLSAFKGIIKWILKKIT